MADDKIRELSEKLMKGVQQIVKPDNYKNYLKLVSSFHSYSFRNTILIFLQCKNASQVKEYQAWKESGRYVKRGEKGISIFSPSKSSVKKNMPVLDEHGLPKMFPDGMPMTENIEKTRIKFSVSTVFDSSQTEGAPLSEICNEKQGKPDYEKIFNAIKKTSPFKVVFEQIVNGSKSYCNFNQSKIVLKTGMSEEQIIKTLIHEFVNVTLHEQSKRSRDRHEFETESVSFIVSSYLDVDTSSYSFGYVDNWSQGMDLEEMKSVLENIQRTANQIIITLQTEFQRLDKVEKGPSGEIQNLQKRISQAVMKVNEINLERNTRIMKEEFLNDEESTILQQLKSFSKADKIRILEESFDEESEETNRRTLRSLILKLKGA